MPIFRVHKNKIHPYTIIDNTSVNDKRLSAKAKGILLFLISKPDNWYINLPNLVSSFTDGERSIRTGINELIKFGYIIRTHVRRNDGRFSFYDYAVYEQPFKESISASYSPPECRNAVLDNAVLENSTLLNTNNKTSTYNTTTPSPANKQKPDLDVDISINNSKKTDTINILNSLGVKNLKKIFDKFSFSDIYKYANWINDNNFNIHNPTGFLFTAIKEKWDTDISPKNITLSDSLFWYTCTKCHSQYGYQKEIKNYKLCFLCGGSN